MSSPDPKKTTRNIPTSRHKLDVLRDLEADSSTPPPAPTIKKNDTPKPHPTKESVPSARKPSKKEKKETKPAASKPSLPIMPLPVLARELTAPKDTEQSHEAVIHNTKHVKDEVRPDRSYPTESPQAPETLIQPQLEAVRMNRNELIAAFPELAAVEAELDANTIAEAEPVAIEATEDMALSTEDLQLLADFQTQLETAHIEDFIVVDGEENGLLTGADGEYADIDQEPATDAFIGEAGALNSELSELDKIVDGIASEVGADSEWVQNQTLNRALDQLPDQPHTTLHELQPPAETPPAVITMVEEISEKMAAIAVLEPEAAAETHTLLQEVGHSLHTLEATLRLRDEAPGSVPTTEQQEAATAAKAELVQHMQKLCEAVGLEYSEDQIIELVGQLLAHPELTHELDGTQADGAETLLATGKGTHERLRWFAAALAAIRHFVKTRPRQLCQHLGRRALAFANLAPTAA